MKTGFVTECHVVIYCHGCGDYYHEHEGESICFDSIHQAITYLSVVGAGTGWVYDGDKIWCDGCIAVARCAEYGHTFPGPRRWPLPSRSDARVCVTCGIAETEIDIEE